MADSMSRARSPSPYSKRAGCSSRREEHQRSQSPHRNYSRSPPRYLLGRERSRSPRERHDDRPQKSGGGFRWKEKPRDDEEGRRDDRRLERGYREHERPRQRSPARDSGRNNDIEAKFGPVKSDGLKASETKSDEQPEKERKKRKARPAIAPTEQPMIIVNVNDRLGTKAAIPCLASDPISTLNR